MKAKYWHVKLPNNQSMWIESKTPDEDLIARGYNAFALTQVTAMGSLDLPPMNQCKSNPASTTKKKRGGA